MAVPPGITFPLVSNYPFYFGGGGPGGGYFSDLANTYQRDLGFNNAGVGLPALAESGVSAGWSPTPFARGGPGQLAAQGAFSQLADSLYGGQIARTKAKDAGIAGDIRGAGDTALGYSNALGGAIGNATEAQYQQNQGDLQTLGMFSDLLNQGLNFANALVGKPGSSNLGTNIGTALGTGGPFRSLFGGGTASAGSTMVPGLGPVPNWIDPGTIMSSSAPMPGSGGMFSSLFGPIARLFGGSSPSGSGSSPGALTTSGASGPIASSGGGTMSDVSSGISDASKVISMISTLAQMASMFA